MLKVVFHMFKDGTEYQELGCDYLSNRRKDVQIKYHREQLKKLLGEDSPEIESAWGTRTLRSIFTGTESLIISPS